MTLGERIAAARNRAGLTQLQLAQELGLPLFQVADWERGGAEPSLEQMAALCRVLDVTLVLRNVCPRRRVAVGISLAEVDGTGGEQGRGFHAMTVPAHTDSACRDVTLPSVRFVLPEDLRADKGGAAGERRHFVVRTSSRYVDSAAQ